MELILTRTHFSDECTIGELSVTGDDFKCFTLEDKDRKLSQTDATEAIVSGKVYGKTAIPYGRYEVAVTFSNHFKKNLPLLMGVKGFEGIRIHAGNSANDSLGCILVGTQKDVVNNRILNSRTAFAELFLLIQEKIQTEKIFITVTNLNK